jgi:hypothetical protein
MYLRGARRRGPRLGVECDVDKIDTAFGALARPIDDQDAAQADRSQFTPGEFFRQAGLVIAVCLGLAMLAQLLVLVVGEY